MTRIDPAWGETVESLLRRSVQTSNKRMRERYLALALVASEKSVQDVARQIGRRRQTVSDWIRRFNRHGMAGLRPGFTRPTRASLTEEEAQTLRQALEQTPETLGFTGAQWQSKQVALYIAQTFEKEVHPETARRYLRRFSVSQNGRKRRPG